MGRPSYKKTKEENKDSPGQGGDENVGEVRQSPPVRERLRRQGANRRLGWVMMDRTMGHQEGPVLSGNIRVNAEWRYSY